MMNIKRWIAAIATCCAMMGAANAIAATAEIVVQDAHKQPITNTSIELRSDKHFMKPVLQSAQLDKDGRARFVDVPANKSIHFCVSVDGYVQAIHSAYLDNDESLRETITLYKPVQCSIRCKAPDGSPLEDVRIGQVVYTNPDSSSVVLTEAEAASLGIAWNDSDKDGKLALPPLPQGGKILGLRLYHPKYWFDHIRSIELHADAELPSAIGKEQCQLTFEFFDADDKPLRPDIPFVELSIDAAAAEELPSEYANMTLRIENGESTVAVPNRVYDMIALKNSDYVFGPILLNNTSYPSKLMDMRDKEQQQIRINAQQIVKASGIVVDNDGKPIPNVMVAASRRTRGTEQFDSSTRPDTGRGKFHREYDRVGGITDASGKFEVDAVVGDTNIIAASSTHLMTDETIALHVDSATTTVPPIRIEMQPMPKLRGRIADAQGNAIAGGVAIVRSAGSYSRSCFAIADQDGNFEIALDSAPLDDNANVMRQVAITAFDANSNAAGVSYVNLADPSQTHSINVTLTPRDAKWIFDSVPHLGTNIHFTPDEHAKILDKMKQAAPDGHPGMVAPQITGTWFNTDKTKLSDFRGKFVFLDFWFIGCGPCEYDLPTIKAAAELYRGDDFEIVSVHVTPKDPMEVEQYLKDKGIDYPVVLLDQDSTVNAAWQRCGVNMYPQYAVIDPDGKFVLNDAVTMEPILRIYKLEQIHRILQESRTKSN